MAQRVLRHVHGPQGRRRGHPLRGRLVVGLRPLGQGVGLSAGPAAQHAPDRRRHPRHRVGDGQLRRHHLRQGRQCPQAAACMGRGGRLRRGPARPLPAARVGQRRAGGLPRRPRGAVGPGPDHLVEVVARDRRGGHAVGPDRDRRRGRADHRRGGAGRPLRTPDAASSPPRHRPVRHGGRRAREGRRRRGRHRRGHDHDRGPRGTTAARSPPAQRRGPCLRQGPPRQPLGGDPRTVPRDHARRGCPCGVLGVVVGCHPRRGAGGPPVRRPGLRARPGRGRRQRPADPSPSGVRLRGSLRQPRQPRRAP